MTERIAMPKFTQISAVQITDEVTRLLISAAFALDDKGGVWVRYGTRPWRCTTSTASDFEDFEEEHD